MMNAAICVVVPAFNRAATILSTLERVAAQTLHPARLVVVDDGSTDATTRTCRGGTMFAGGVSRFGRLRDYSDGH
jgi:glycosyltransferase involved in cell wall biosynthesis